MLTSCSTLEQRTRRVFQREALPGGSLTRFFDKLKAPTPKRPPRELPRFHASIGSSQTTQRTQPHLQSVHSITPTRGQRTPSSARSSKANPPGDFLTPPHSLLRRYFS